MTHMSAASQADTVESRIRAALDSAFAPTQLEIVNESELHAGHRGSPGTGDSHFRVRIVSERFAGLPQVARHRLVNRAMAELIGKPIHALALTTRAPDESAD